MFRFIKIFAFQQIANMFTRKLEKTKNEEQWKKTFQKAMTFNEFCVN